VRLLRAATRKFDRLFRYGGEEFVVLYAGLARWPVGRRTHRQEGDDRGWRALVE
jgi:GGDEF domain-containing protein